MSGKDSDSPASPRSTPLRSRNRRYTILRQDLRKTATLQPAGAHLWSDIEFPGTSRAANNEVRQFTAFLTCDCGNRRIFSNGRNVMSPSNNPVAATEASGRCHVPVRHRPPPCSPMRYEGRRVPHQCSEQACIGYVRHVPIVPDDSTPTCNLRQSCVPSPQNEKGRHTHPFHCHQGKRYSAKAKGM